MNALNQSEGRCLCGAVTLIAQKLSPEVGVCHCSTCRKWNGGPFFATSCDSVDIQGLDKVSLFQSSDWAERGFCQNCGTHLFYRLKDNQQYILPVDLFDLDQELQLSHQVFIDEKPDYYSFANKTENLTGAQVFAQFQTPGQ